MNLARCGITAIVKIKRGNISICEYEADAIGGVRRGFCLVVISPGRRVIGLGFYLGPARLVRYLCKIALFVPLPPPDNPMVILLEWVECGGELALRDVFRSYFAHQWAS